MDLAGLVQSLPIVPFVLIELFLAGMAAVCLVAAVHARRRAALVEATPTEPIAFAENGYREFEGSIQPIGDPQAAPLTGWACVWYRWKVEKFVGKRTRADVSGWRRVAGGESEEAFVLRDATGACLVKPHGAEVTPTDFSVWYGATREPEDRNPPRRAATEARTPAVEIAGGTSYRYRYTEERIYAGDPLLALGHFNAGRLSAPAATAVAMDPRGDLVHRGGAVVDIRAVIAKGEGKPFVLTTTSQAAHVAMHQFGGQAAIYLAALPLGAAALLAYVRFR
jgi:hypothetical protein